MILDGFFAISAVLLFIISSTLILNHLPGKFMKIFFIALALGGGIPVGINYGEAKGLFVAGLIVISFYTIVRIIDHALKDGEPLFGRRAGPAQMSLRREQNEIRRLKRIIGFFTGIVVFQSGLLDGFLVGALLCGVVALASKITGLTVTTEIK